MKAAKSHIFSNPTYALAGLIKCRCCDATIEQISAKGGGYYGCCNAKTESCSNKLRISRSQVEVIILNDLKEKFLTAQSLKYIDALALKDLLGTIDLEPVQGKYSLAHAQLIRGCSYYVAHTSIQTVALLYEAQKDVGKSISVVLQ